MRQFIICFSMALLWTASANAISCVTGKTASGCTGSTNTAADCKALGYSKIETPNCNHYLRCPFDDSYKICVNDPQGTQCPDGYSLSVTAATCGSSIGWKFLTNGKVSTYDCGKCECQAPTECKWDSNNKGSANLSDACCDGTSKTCASTCKEITVPANATASATCTGCGKTVNTDFKCNDGYAKSADGKNCKKKITCSIGDFFYADSTCTKTKRPTEIPIGFVADIDSDNTYVLARDEVGLSAEDYDENGNPMDLGYIPGSCGSGSQKPAPQYGCMRDNVTIPTAEEVLYSYRPCGNSSFRGHWIIPTQDQWERIAKNKNKLNEVGARVNSSYLASKTPYGDTCPNQKPTYVYQMFNNAKACWERCPINNLSVRFVLVL